jgi:hypothetical protein
MIEEFSWEQHGVKLRTWLKQHGINGPKRSWFPKVGFIADGVIIGFLVQTDSKVAWIDHFVADPNSDKRVRDRACRALIEGIRSAAFERGYEAVTILANKNSMKRRILDLGFNPQDDYTFFSYCKEDTCLG